MGSAVSLQSLPKTCSADSRTNSYLARTPSPSSAPTSGSSSTAPSSPTRPPLRPTSSSRPPSPSKLRSFTGAPQGSLNDDRQFEFDAKFNTFGSTLSPQDNWCCVSCEKKFVQVSCFDFGAREPTDN